MSKENIISILDLGAASETIGEAFGAVLGGGIGVEIGEAVGKVAGDVILVTFQCHGGEQRTYQYTGRDADAIRAGADPANYSGERIS